MKKNATIIIILVLSSLTINAQDVNYSDTKHEISFQAADIYIQRKIDDIYYCYEMDMISSYCYPYYETPQEKTMFGIAYKYHFRNSAIRLSSAALYKYNEQNNNDYYGSNNYEYTSLYLISSSYVGYEYDLNIKRLQLNFGSDIGFKYTKNNNNSSSSYNYYLEDDAVEYYTYTSNSKTEEKSYRLAPFFGLKFFITKNISISAETKMYVEYLDYKSSYHNKNVYNNAAYENDQTTINNEMNFGYIPFSNISLNVHF